MNSWHGADYLLFPPQPTTDWSAAVLASDEQRTEPSAVISKVPYSGTDTPLQMRITQAAPGSHYSSVSQGAPSAATGQAVSVNPLTYAQTLRNMAAPAPDTGNSDNKGRRVVQQNLIRLQHALQSGAWIPGQGHLPVTAVAWDIGRQMDSYFRNLLAELAMVHEPLERCLRVSVCVSTLVQKYNCLNDDVAFNYLKTCFGALFLQTLQPCIAAIKSQATAGYARDYFEVLHFALNFCQYCPDSVAPEGVGIGSEISTLLNNMIEVELDYLRYTLAFHRRGEDFWLICGLNQLLAAKGLFRRLGLISEQTAQACLQQLQVLEHALQQPDRASLDFPHKFDLLIAAGDLQAVSTLLAAHNGVYPFQERLVYEILKYECLNVVADHWQVISIEQQLAQLLGLNLFTKTYRPFIASHFFLFHQVRLLLSDLVDRLLTRHKTKISHHEKRLEVEAIISELATAELLSDHCLSLWRDYRQSVLPVEDSLAGLSSRDGIALFKTIAERLSAKTRTNEDYQQSANELRRWIINEHILTSMNQGMRLVRELRALRHRLYLHFFHKIITDGFVVNKNDLTDYHRVIEVMDQHRKECLKNQAMVFLLKDDRHRCDWQQIACRAWGKLICTLREKIKQKQAISEAEFDDVLSLSEVSPVVEHGLTRVDLKRLVIDVFKAAVFQPDIIQVSHYKLQRLAYWVLAIVEMDPVKCVDSAGHNGAIRKRIAGYFDFVRQKHKLANRMLPSLPREVLRILDGKPALSRFSGHPARANGTEQIGGEKGAMVHSEAVSTQPVDSFHESLLDCLPLCIVKQGDYRGLEENMRRISIVLLDILNRSVTDYESITKSELDCIDLCLTNIAPWFQKLCSQKESQIFFNELSNLTKSDSDSNKIHQAFTMLITSRMQQGDIAGVTNIVCIQQGLYRVRAALGLTPIGRPACEQGCLIAFEKFAY